MLAPCPSGCGHLAALHDVYDVDDPYPTCCAEGCPCGKPGEAMVRRLDDGTVEVLAAPPVIRLSRELLDQMAADASPLWNPDTEVLLLDTAGQYRYGYLRPDPADRRVAIFGRAKS
jgi:hypothetical protein